MEINLLQYNRLKAIIHDAHVKVERVCCMVPFPVELKLQLRNSVYGLSKEVAESEPEAAAVE